MGLFVYTQKGSIISMVVLPTTEIIEPKKPTVQRIIVDTIGFFFIDYFTVRTRIVFVEPDTPTGTPATITILSPDSTRPCSKQLVLPIQTYHQLSLVFQLLLE